MKKFKCGECGIDNVRLYRPYGHFYRPEDNRCNVHITLEQRGWYVPLCTDDRDGTVWRYTSVPPDALERFYVLPENNLFTWTWAKTRFYEGWFLGLSAYRDEVGKT